MPIDQFGWWRSRRMSWRQPAAACDGDQWEAGDGDRKRECWEAIDGQRILLTRITATRQNLARLAPAPGRCS
jgi:hypothetical protein